VAKVESREEHSQRDSDGLCLLYPTQAVLRFGGRRRHRDFDLSLDNVCSCRVALLFKMTVRTDSNELRDVECAMTDVFLDYAEGR
jgi:hypothetical protein